MLIEVEKKQQKSQKIAGISSLIFLLVDASSITFGDKTLNF